MTARTKAVWVYMTAKDTAEAKKIGRELVRSRLAACVNILGGMRSVYRWEGKMEEAKETVLIAKTSAPQADKLIRKVKSMHSYSCPCVIVLPVINGNQDYLKWVISESSQPAVPSRSRFGRLR